MKQPLGAVAAWLAAGILVGRYLPVPLTLLFPISLAVGLAVLLARQWTREWCALFLLLTGWTNLAWRQGALAPIDLRHLAVAPEELSTLRGCLASTPEQRLHSRNGGVATNTFAVLDCVARRIPGGAWSPARGQVLVSITGTLPADFHRTSPVEISGILRRPSGPLAPGTFDYATFLRWRDIHFELRTATPADWRHADPGSEVGPPWDERFQAWAKRTLALGLPRTDTEMMLLWTMILGWKTGLTEEVEEPFMRSGTMHIFAISGLHIALIAEILIGVLRFANLPRSVAGLVSLPLVWLYTAATGWQPSAIRASFMTSVVVGGWVLARPSNLLNSLGTAATLILLWDPTQLFQAGFQLSFAAVAAIGALSPRLLALAARQFARDPLLPAEVEPRWSRILRYLGMKFAEGIAVSGAAWLGTLPLTAHHFHLVSLSSLVANLIVVPLSTLALASGMASLACGAWLPSASVLFNHSGWFWMRAMIRISQFAADLPGGCWNVASPSIAVHALWYLTLGGIVTRVWRPCRARRVVAVAAIALVLATALPWWWHRDDRRLVVLPLRGGHAIWIQTPEGTGLADTGDERSAKAVVDPFLQALGRNGLPWLSLTHGDIRHVGGAAFLAGRYPPSNLWIPDARFRSSAYRSVVTQMVHQATGSPRLWRVRDGDRLDSSHGIPLPPMEGSPVTRPGRTLAAQQDDRPRWQILHPAAGELFARADDASLVMYLRTAETSILVTGDLGPKGQQRLHQRHPDLRSEVVITGLTDRGEGPAPRLLECWGTRILVIADAQDPATARASKALKEELRRASDLSVLFTSEHGPLDLRFHRGRWEIVDARGRTVLPGPLAPGPRAGSAADESGIVASDEI
ncbi:MAG: ComEC/Rec2 family competence protein [Verrucomicrobiales bacterium]|nr:ComEC/Rec2 family competence protein [Verrucomicrobiales bacterium]